MKTVLYVIITVVLLSISIVILFLSIQDDLSSYQNQKIIVESLREANKGQFKTYNEDLSRKVKIMYTKYEGILFFDNGERITFDKEGVSIWPYEKEK